MISLVRDGCMPLRTIVFCASVPEAPTAYKEEP